MCQPHDTGFFIHILESLQLSAREVKSFVQVTQPTLTAVPGWLTYHPYSVSQSEENIIN